VAKGCCSTRSKPCSEDEKRARFFPGLSLATGSEAAQFQRFSRLDLPRDLKLHVLPLDVLQERRKRWARRKCHVKANKAPLDITAWPQTQSREMLLPLHGGCHMEALIFSTSTTGIFAKRLIKLLADVLRIFVFSSCLGLVHGARMSGICDRGLV
jgi:hypothetical protein